MPKNPNQKLKLLYMMRILQEKSDEAHPLTMSQIMEELFRYDIKAERKSVYDDLEALRSYGLDVEKTKGRSCGYYIANRVFELPELKLLVDAVQSSKFITRKKSDELIKKVESFASVHEAQLLQRQVYVANRVKSMNESIYYNIDKIVRAVGANQKISFLYFEYLPDKTLQLRRDGRRYEASPYSLMWFEDAYYLVCNMDKYDNLSHFRVDRMTRVEIMDEPRRPVGEVSEYKNYIDFDEYHRSVFFMFGGKPQQVRIRFCDDLATAVFDRLGLDVDVSNIKDGCFTVSASVRVSPGFLSWLTVFGDKAEVLYPESLREDMKQLIASLAGVYERG
jgi:predicted DNA-binding transcriptional regulator YafY